MRAFLRVLSIAVAAAALPGTSPGQAITKQPLLQTMRSSELWLQWETDSDPTPGQHFVDWGVASVAENTSASTQTLMVDASHFVHRAALTGLQPGARYRYRVRSGASLSPEYSFGTAPPAGGSFRMAWISDNQNQAGNPFIDVLSRIVPRAVDFIGHAGDTVQNGNLVQEWEELWAVPLESADHLGQTTPVLVARGNHDGEWATAHAYHWLPGNGSWYAETIGSVRFVFLDSNLPMAAQTQWLEDELASPASQEAAFRIAVFHHVPYTNLWCDASGYNGEVWTRENFVPLFELYGVDLVVSGHAHAYERGEQNGVIYTVVGGAGGLLDTIVPPETWDFLDVALPVHHYVIMEVEGGRLRWTAYDLEDQVIDAFEVLAPVPVPALGPAALAALALGLVAATARMRRRARA